MVNTAVVSVRQHLGEGLGASEIAAALGLSRWKAPITLWLEKTGRQPRTEAGEPAYWGNRLEPIVRAEYVERHGVEVHVPTRSEYHPQIAWARATPDGYVMKSTDGALVKSHLLECKTVGLRLADDWGDEGAEQVPDYYYTQAVWSMFVTGLARVDFAVLIGGQRYFEATVHRDQALETEIVASAREFMRCVEENIAPPVDASEEHARYLRKLVTQRPKAVEAPAGVEELALKWRDLVREEKRIENEEALLKNQILAACVDLGSSKVKTSIGQLTVSAPGEKNTRDYEGLARDLASRLQLCGEAIDFDAELLKRTTTTPSDGSLRRPNHWTKESK